MNRYNGKIVSDLDFEEMENFVGNLFGEQWIGLKLMHRLTAKGTLRKALFIKPKQALEQKNYLSLARLVIL